MSAKIDETTYTLTAVDQADEADYATFNANAAQKNPNIFTLLSVGGRSASDAATMAIMAADSSLRQTFITSSVNNAIENKFNGVEIHWIPKAADKVYIHNLYYFYLFM